MTSNNITASPPLEHHIIHAALIATRAASTPSERSEASSFLQTWDSSADADDPFVIWGAYVNLLKSFRSSSTSSSDRSSSAAVGDVVESIARATSSNNNNHTAETIRREATGAKLLLLTLLSNKIRSQYNSNNIRSLTKEHPTLARALYRELLSLLIQNCRRREDDTTLTSALSTAVTCVVVRTGAQFPQEGSMNMLSLCRASIEVGLGFSSDRHRHGEDGMVLLPPAAALKLLGDIPREVASRTDLTLCEMDSFLTAAVPTTMHSMDVTSAALDILQLALSSCMTCGNCDEQSDTLLCLTLTALTNWTEGSPSASISQLNRVVLLLDNDSTTTTLLSHLVTLLSSPLKQKQWSNAFVARSAISQSARALTAAIANSSDYGTTSRRNAVNSLLSGAMVREFLNAPLQLSQIHQWEDTIVALSILACTIAKEEMEEIAPCRRPGCLELFELLLELQSHELHRVAVPVLEVWLALQDVPTSERHPHLANPLYRRLVEVLLNRVAYPSAFVSWEEEVDVESSEFEEMRRLSSDILIGAYELLRSDYLETLSTVVTTANKADWEVIESALFCLCAVAREACARVKSAQNAVRSGRDSPAAVDGSNTASGLTQMVASLCEGGAASVANQHPLVLSGIANFLGSYSMVWNKTCPANSILEILSILSSSMAVSAAAEAAGKGMRLVLVSCSSKLVQATSAPGSDPAAYNHISAVLAQCMHSALSTGDAKVMASVAEGCCRLTVQLGDKNQSRTILSSIAESTLQQSRSALDTMVSSSSIEGSGHAASQSDAASQVLASCLGVLRELIRFCDGVKFEEGQPHVLADLLNSAWPVLHDISNQTCCRSNELVLTGLLEVHSQLLSVVPTLIGPYFKDLISFVVRAYEETFTPSALDYVSAAVESFGSEQSAIASAAGFDDNAKDAMFNQLLAHLSQCSFTYITQTKRPCECPQVISALFNMAQRYLLFCPAALCQCPEFANLFALAVTCLSECKGEVESTRSSLIFLHQLIGWKHLRLTGPKLASLEQAAATIDNLLVQHGECIMKSSLLGMSGPQMLWPSFSECIFSIMLHVAESSPVLDENSILHRWLYSAMNDSGSGSQNITPGVGASVVKLLCDFAREGGKSKPRAKMLLMDYGKISKGETGKDALLAYSLD